MAVAERRRFTRDGTDAWGEVVRRYAPYVHAVVVRAFRLPEPEAEEVFQMVFARTWEELGELGGDDVVRERITALTLELGREAGERAGADPPAPEVLKMLDEALARQQDPR